MIKFKNYILLLNNGMKKKYEDAIIEMEKLKEYRKTIPDNIKKRMSFPTPENYEEMAKYDREFNV